MLYASTQETPKVKYTWKVKNEKFEADLDIAEFIDVKGWKALGNKLGDFKALTVKSLETAKPEKKAAIKPAPPVEEEEMEDEMPVEKAKAAAPEKKKPAAGKAEETDSPEKKYGPGDSIDFDIEDNGQVKLF